MDTVLDETIFKSYRQFQALCELYNFEMMVFLQPQIVFEDPNLLSELDNKIQKLTLKHDKND